MVNQDTEFVDEMIPMISGHILIRDVTANEVLLNKRDDNPSNKKINSLSKYPDLQDDEVIK
jgi:hypothetical protein